MPKIVNTKVICACCGNKVSIDRVLSFSYDNVGLSGNKHTPMQYIMEEQIMIQSYLQLKEKR